jgi:hypothetical protein
VPDIGVTVAGIAVAASIGLLLIYLDRFTHSLRPVAVAALVGRSGQQVLADWLPQFHLKDVGAIAIRGSAAPVQVVRARRAGAVQAVNLRAMVAAAQRHDSTIVLARSIGDFVTPGALLLEVHGAALPDGGKQLRGLFALGRERTIEQDPAFALRILVDIAVKALSPAVNDPTTAVQVLDHIEAFVVVLSRSELHGRYAVRPRRRGSGGDPWSRLGGVPRARRDRNPRLRGHVDPGLPAVTGAAGRLARDGSPRPPGRRARRAMSAGCGGEGGVSRSRRPLAGNRQRPAGHWGADCNRIAGESRGCS